MARTPEQIIESTIDATFMQRGFNPKRHMEAVMKALNEAGYQIVPKKNQSPTSASIAAMRALAEAGYMPVSEYVKQAEEKD